MSRVKTSKNQVVMLAAASRADEMYRLYMTGETLQDIANKFGISKQRVSQIFNVWDLKTRPKSYRKAVGK